MQTLLVNQSPVSSITYSNKIRVIYDGVEQDAELRKYPSGKIYFRTENAHFVPVNEVGVLIPLTKGKSAIVDFEDYERITAMGKWHCCSYGYARITKKIQPHNKRFAIIMHRLITDVNSGVEIDHINGNKIDNRKNNLRYCSRSENVKNVGIRKDNKSGYKGVSWVERDRKWCAYISSNGKRYSLGHYSDPHLAAIAYNNAAKILHGEFAFFNTVTLDL